VEPHLKLQELYGDEFFVEIITAGTDGFDWDNENMYKDFDICHFHRALPIIKDGQLQPAYGEDAEKLFKKLKKHNVKLVMDLDDYWMVTYDHPAYHNLKKAQIDKDIKHNLKLVDYVTTTTPLYAEKISKLNKNVIVLPNAVDPSEEQFQPNPEPTDKKMRIGWLGGSSHLADLSLISFSVTNFLSKHKEDTQFVLCGFDLRGDINEENVDTGVITRRKIRPEESVWTKYEKLFTNDYDLVTPEYKKELLSYDDRTDGKEENYRRVWNQTNYNICTEL